jgi:hypothetical protein
MMMTRMKMMKRCVHFLLLYYVHMYEQVSETPLRSTNAPLCYCADRSV